MSKSFLNRKNHLSMEISGGLGNQLFQLAGLTNFALDYNLKPVINLSKISSGRVPRELMIPPKLIQTLIPENSRFESNTPFTTCFKKIIWRFESIFPSVKIRNIYFAKGIGFDPGPDSNFSYNRISGYFQSFRYPDKLGWKDKFSQFTPSSNKFISLQKELMKSDPIVIHIRGMDYISDQTGIGNLGSSYFSIALKIAKKPKQKIWVFTDDLEYAHRILTPIKISYTIIDEQRELNAIETIYLISSAKKIIISNSTFAWWAAYLSSEAQVYAPKKWFKDMEDPLDLIPPTWNRLDSIWTS